MILKKYVSLMDNFKIKKKLLFLYIFCVLTPLIITDSIVIYLVFHSVQVSNMHEMENVANAVQYSFFNGINNAVSMGKTIYTNNYINELLEKDYKNPLDYVTSYQDFFKGVLFDNGISMELMRITLYTDNNTIVQGGKLQKIKNVENNQWYRYLNESDKSETVRIFFDTSKTLFREPKRRIMFAKKLDFYNNSKYNKIVTVDLDYTETVSNLSKMNFSLPVYICSEGKILMSNGEYNSAGMDFQDYKPKGQVFSKELNMYNQKFTIIVEQPSDFFLKYVEENISTIILLLLVNIFLPLLFALGFNRSFTVRISELSNVFNKIDDEKLVEISDVRGKDEIGKLMHNYNRMVRRINSLISTVYVAKMKEQEMTVARKNAELLALHSQINPHFLFNALESIRMHSILKMEYETADMVNRLALLQRQHLEWTEDYVEIEREMEFVRAYLELQKYRFGDKLSYSLNYEDCKDYHIPKLTIVTFVENACVHGIESKINPGWVFVRIYKNEDSLIIEVEDTGNGMDEGFMNDLLTQMRSASLNMLKEKGRVGIVNACLRLKLFTNDEAYFDLDSEKGMGTIIHLKIPLKYVELMV